jgi:hypothetical protein
MRADQLGDSGALAILSPAERVGLEFIVENGGVSAGLQQEFGDAD